MQRVFCDVYPLCGLQRLGAFLTLEKTRQQSEQVKVNSTNRDVAVVIPAGI